MSEQPTIQLPEDKPLELAGRVYQSRLLVGTGKYRDLMETGHAIERLFHSERVRNLLALRGRDHGSDGPHLLGGRAGGHALGHAPPRDLLVARSGARVVVVTRSHETHAEASRRRRILVEIAEREDVLGRAARSVIVSRLPAVLALPRVKPVDQILHFVW